MALPLNNPSESVEELDIGEFLSKMFAEDPQQASYDDNPELSTQIAFHGIASWTSPPLPAPNVNDRAESSHAPSGPIDVTTNLIPRGFTATDFGIEPPTSGEASGSTQEVIQELPLDDEFFSRINLDPDRNSIDPVQHQAFPFNAAQDDMLGLSGPDENLSTTPFFNLGWFEASTPRETAGCPQTANATTWESPFEGGWSSISNMAPPAADLARAHNPAWVPPFADPEPSSEATMSVISSETISLDPAETTPHGSSEPVPPTQIAPIVRDHMRLSLPQAPHDIYAPHLPRESPNTNALLAGNRQSPSSWSGALLEKALVPHAHASALHSGHKRTRNALEDIVPASYLYQFDLSKSIGFGEDGKQLSEPRKRTKRNAGKVGRSCSRCKLQHIKCSDTFPCTVCKQLLQRRAQRYYDVTVQRVPRTVYVRYNVGALACLLLSICQDWEMMLAAEQTDVDNMTTCRILAFEDF